MNNVFWSAADISQSLGIRRTLSYRLLAECPAAFHVGRLLRVQREDFLAWLREEGGDR